jgi:hypothetical protein
LEFEDGAQEIKLEYAAVDLRIHPSLTLRAGMILSPLGRFNLSHDSPLNEFTDRPLVATDLLGVALSEPGAGAFGQFGVGPSGRLTYELFATNGFDDGLITRSPEGTRIALGRGNFEDQNAQPAIVGRVAWSPAAGQEFGLSMHRGAYNTFRTEGTRVDERRDLAIYVADAEVIMAGTRFAGEAALATIDIAPSLTGIYASAQRGLYVEATRDMGHGWLATAPSSFFTLKARFDYVDFDSDRMGQSVIQLSVGANFRPTRDSALKLDFVRGRARDEFNNSSERAALLASIATYF